MVTLCLDNIPIYRLPIHISVGHSCLTTLAASDLDLDELRVQVHQISEAVYVLAIVPLVLTRLLCHSVLDRNRGLLNSSLKSETVPTTLSFEAIGDCDYTLHHWRNHNLSNGEFASCIL